MQSVSSRIWTRVTVSNSYDDNHYPTGTSKPTWYSPTTVGFVSYLWAAASYSTVMGLPDLAWSSRFLLHEPTIWLLNSDQLFFRVSLYEWFFVASAAKVPELVNIARSSVRLSDNTRSETTWKQRETTTILTITAGSLPRTELLQSCYIRNTS